MANPKKYYPKEEAAKIIGYSGKTLDNWRHLHKGPPYLKLNNGKIRYPEDELIKWADKHLVTPEA